MIFIPLSDDCWPPGTRITFCTLLVVVPADDAKDRVFRNSLLSRDVGKGHARFVHVHNLRPFVRTMMCLPVHPRHGVVELWRDEVTVLPWSRRGLRCKSGEIGKLLELLHTTCSYGRPRPTTEVFFSTIVALPNP